ncbi:MAG TPA: hypothetical protein DD412_06445 [Holosporales bacterium]|nr:hypothetical protein [Holosporales bacterium]
MAKDFKRAHENMLFRQFLPNKLTDERLLHAFEEVWREKFIPAPSNPLSYCDQNVKLPVEGREALSPLSLMRLLQAAAPTKKHRVLNIASGTGFGAVILSYLARSIVCLEEDDKLYSVLLETIQQFSSTYIKPVKEPLTEGVPLQGPYDLIFIEGAVSDVPFSILEQLDERGKLFTYEPLFDSSVHQISRAVCFERYGKTYTKTFLFEAIAPRLEMFEKQKEFQL